MKKILLTIPFALLILTGCGSSTYELDEPISPGLEGLQEPDDFYDTGWEMNYDVTVPVVDNLADDL